MKQKLFLLSFLFLSFSKGVFSQTILAPDLQCVQNDAVNGNITLSWTNPPANPCGAFVQYTIYASSTGAAGPYNQAAVTNQAATSYLLTGYLSSSPTWYFYMEANYNCAGGTVLQSDTVNNLSPITPQIINVDADANDNVVFNWQPSVSPQTHFYIIYYYLPGSGNAVPLDTVYGRFNTTFTDLAGLFTDPSTESINFTISAVDSCGKVSSFNTSYQRTIFLTTSSVACQNQINLAWNNYLN